MPATNGNGRVYMYLCARCGTEVEQPVIVPPYLDSTSFRCAACVTPEEQACIDEADRALRESCISWEEIEAELGPERYEQFTQWMLGQTVCQYGVYRWDYEQFKCGGRSLD